MAGVFSVLLVTAALVPFANAGSGLEILVDAQGDHVNGGGSASDVLRLGATTDATNLDFFIEVAGADHPKLIYYEVTFSFDGETYDAFTSYTTSGSFSSSYVRPQSNPNTLRPIGAEWIGSELKLTVARADVGSPPEGGILADVDVETRHGASGDAFDATAAADFRIGNSAAPILDPIGDKSVDESVALAFTVTATDADNDTLTFSAEPLPTGATLNATTGEFAWTPGFDQAGVHVITFTVTDGGPTDSESINVTVGNVNRAPVLDAVGDKTVAENETLAFTVAASDADGENVTLSSSALPAGAEFNATSGEFAWTPGFDQAGAHSITFTASDGDLTDEETITINVTNVNRPVTLDAVGDKSVAENETLAFTLTATDADADDAHTFSATGLPAGATLNATTGAFSWKPTFEQAGSYAVTFNVTDGETEDGEAITITVTDVNRAPVLDPIGDKSVHENATLTFTVTASDADGDAVTLGASPLPGTATFDPATGVFHWETDFDDAGTYDVNFTASDGSLEDFEVVTITVIDVNRAPVLDPVGNKSVAEDEMLAFTLTATDPDGDALTFSAAGLPAGATLDAQSGQFSWTPTFLQAGNYTVTFRVSDGTSTDAETIRIEVFNVNRAAVLDAVGDKTVDENATLAFTLTATDPDTDDTLTFSASGLPAGATLTGADFSWTPDFTQAGAYEVTFSVTDGNATDSETITITVVNVNRAPTLAPVADLTVNESEALTIDLDGTDPDGETLTYEVIGALPAGATFDNATGVLEWTPDNRSAGSHALTFRVTDGEASDSESATVTVLEIAGPAMDPITDQVVNEGQLLEFAVTATDPDGDALEFTSADLPGGATFDAATGAFSWRPNWTAVGQHTVTFTVSDGSLEDSASVLITVLEDDTPPILDPIGPKSVLESYDLAFTVTAWDPDGEALTLSAEPLPFGAAFDAATGAFAWTPGYNQSGSYVVTFSATDGSFASTEDVTITVNDLAPNPVITVNGGTTRDTSPDEPVTFQVRVKNGAIGKDVLTLSATGPAGWGLALDATTLALEAGESALVNLTVTPTDSPLSGSVTFRVKTASGGDKATSLTVRIPVFVDLELSKETYSVADTVGGIVSVKYMNGAPAADQLVRVRETGPVGGPRSYTVTTDATGFADVELALSPVGANMVGSHTVQADITSGPNAERLDTETYEVVLV